MKSNPACECSAAAGAGGAAYKSIYVPFDNSAHALRAVDLVNAWSYFDSHPEEIENAIRENEAA